MCIRDSVCANGEPAAAGEAELYRAATPGVVEPALGREADAPAGEPRDLDRTGSLDGVQLEALTREPAAEADRDARLVDHYGEPRKGEHQGGEDEQPRCVPVSIH